MATIIRPTQAMSLQDVRELWQYRELFYFLTWRDLKVRYKQTAIGVLWAVFQPLITMVVFSVFFGKLVQVPSEGVPYPIFIYSGLLIWQLFSSALSETSNILLSNQSIITKVFFPRLILPISAIVTKFVDFFFASFVLVGLMIYYQYTPHLIGIILLPWLLLLTFFLATGAGLFLAALNVRYRDVRYALPFFIQLLLFISPVIYPPSIAGSYAWLLTLNPLTGILTAARSSLLHTGSIPWMSLGLSTVFSIVLLVIGFLYFKRTERYFADLA